eukprot:2241917-Prymnesium_polylepis.1
MGPVRRRAHSRGGRVEARVGHGMTRDPMGVVFRGGLPTWDREESCGVRELSGARWLERHTWGTQDQTAVSRAERAESAALCDGAKAREEAVKAERRAGEEEGEYGRSSGLLPCRWRATAHCA